jgi:hypothetical protein
MIFLLTRTVVKTSIQVLVLSSQNSTFRAQDISSARKVSGTVSHPFIFYSNMSGIDIHSMPGHSTLPAYSTL